MVLRTSVILFFCVGFSLCVWAATTYTVQKGDTIYSISRKCGVEPKALLRANPKLKPDHVIVGQKIKIPRDVDPNQVATVNPPPPAPDPTVNQPGSSEAGSTSRKAYRVQKGDTLSKIARENRLTLSQIRKINGLSSDIIHKGQLLYLNEEMIQKALPPTKTSDDHDESLTNTGPEGDVPPVAVEDESQKVADSNYVFVSKVKAQIDSPAKLRPWEYIVVHHSGTPNGNAKIFNYYHLKVRGMENGLAYHFVIGNGTDSGDGEIEVGPRWLKQIQGGHVASDYLNEIAIGICLVGDFNTTRPTTRQIASLVELINYLTLKCKSPRPIFKLHREINPRPTDCPGRFFPEVAMHKLFG